MSIPMGETSPSTGNLLTDFPPPEYAKRLGECVSEDTTSTDPTSTDKGGGGMSTPLMIDISDYCRVV